MEWLGDTEEVKKLINELLKSEDLINVYSEDYFQKRNDSEFNLEILEELKKENGDEFLNHLLVGCFHGNHENLMKLVHLLGINEKEHPVLMSYNAPSFVFINLKTQNILIFGLWKRKAKTIEKIIYSSSQYSNQDFEDLDYLGVVESVREDFEEIANGICPALDGLSEEELDELYKGRNGNYFREEDEANEVDKHDEDEGITQEEIAERYEELKEAECLMEDAEYSLQYFFPKFTIANFWIILS